MVQAVGSDDESWINPSWRRLKTFNIAGKIRKGVRVPLDAEIRRPEDYIERGQVLDIQPDVILHAPDARSEETAEIMRKFFTGGFRNPQVRASELLAEGTRGEFTKNGIQGNFSYLDTVMCIASGDVLMSQFNPSSGMKENRHGIALVHAFHEASWDKVGPDTRPRFGWLLTPDLGWE